MMRQCTIDLIIGSFRFNKSKHIGNSGIDKKLEETRKTLYIGWKWGTEGVTTVQFIGQNASRVQRWANELIREMQDYLIEMSFRGCAEYLINFSL
jgi:hypothetical protein